MTDSLCRNFFTEPTQPMQRRYDILRAHFVEENSIADLAERFQLNFYTVRSWVREFRKQCQAGNAPPLFSIPSLVARIGTRDRPLPDCQIYPKSPTAVR